MLKKLLFSICLIFLLVFSSAAMAQNMPPGKWWKNPKVAEELNLSDSDVSQLDQAYNNSRREMLKHKSAIESGRFELQTLFENKTMDEGAIKNQHQKVEKAKTDLSSERLGFIMTVRKIIGPEKFGRLKSIFADFHRNRAKQKKGQDKPHR